MNEIKTLDELLKNAWRYESGKRLFPYDVFKWWGRRPALLIQGLLLDALDIDLNDVSKYVTIRLHHKYSELLRGLTVCDPMCGGGTTCIEALFLKASKVLCSDIDPLSVLVVKATLEIMSEKCKEIVSSLLNAMKMLTDEVNDLWCINEYCYLHTFLTRDCKDYYCIVPRWVGIRRVRGRVIKFAITEMGDIVEEPSVTINEKVRIPRNKLVEVSNGVYAYAVELYKPRSDSGVERTFVSLIKDEAIPEHLAKAQEKSRSLLKEVCTPIPDFRETIRLKRSGIYCWEDLFTPRQLLTLKLFIEKSRRISPWSLDVTVAVIGSAIRTLSLLAFYHQPWGKVNPGLVIKSYWLPKYPVELNPLAGDLENLKTIGRGTLLTYIKKINKACELYKEQDLDIDDSVKVECKDAFEVKYNECDVVILDPPYPSKIEYEAMIAVYGFARSLAQGKFEYKGADKKGINMFNLDVYSSQLSSLIEKIVLELKRNGKIYLLLSNDRRAQRVVETIKERLKNINLNLNIEEKGPYMCEAPGTLGRSTNRKIIVLKITKG